MFEQAEFYHHPQKRRPIMCAPEDDSDYKDFRDIPNITQLLDKIHALISLVDILTVSLTHQDYKDTKFIQNNVASILCDYVTPQLTEIEKTIGRL